jgi:serine/threonine-protein kinase
VNDVPAELDAITMRALSRTPANRYETARHMALALEQAAPVATSTTVGEWVSALAERQLAEHSRIMREIDAGHGARGEESVTPGEGLAEDVELDPSMVRPQASVVETLPHTREPAAQTKPWVYALAGALAVAVLSVAVVAIALRGRSPSETAVAAPSASPSPTLTVAPAASESNPATPASAPAGAANEGAVFPSGAAAAVTPRPHAALPAGPVPHPRAAPRTAPSSKTVKPDCSPPYTVDEIGVRHYKPECQ